MNAADIRQRAEKAKRTPDLEWAYDLVHGLADDVLALLDLAEIALRIRHEDTRFYGNAWETYPVLRDLKAVADSFEGRA